MTDHTFTPAQGAQVTPAAKWRVNGEADPHGKMYDCERAKLAHGDMTDDEIANALFLKNYDIGIITAAKERIRWLSRALESALAAQPPAAPVDNQSLAQAMYAEGYAAAKAELAPQHSSAASASDLPWWKILADNWRGRNGNSTTGDSVRNSCADELEKCAKRHHSAQPQSRGWPTLNEQGRDHPRYDNPRDPFALPDRIPPSFPQGELQRSAGSEPVDWQFKRSDGKWISLNMAKRPEAGSGEQYRPVYATEPQEAPDTKLVYVKRWRTLVALPIKYADEIVEALR